jgi:hypothetical protein
LVRVRKEIKDRKREWMNDQTWKTENQVSWVENRVTTRQEGDSSALESHQRLQVIAYDLRLAKSQMTARPAAQ